MIHNNTFYFSIVLYVQFTVGPLSQVPIIVLEGRLYCAQF